MKLKLWKMSKKPCSTLMREIRVKLANGTILELKVYDYWGTDNEWVFLTKCSVICHDKCNVVNIEEDK